MNSNSSRKWPDAVSPLELECLIMWPPNTFGETEEREALRVLNALCKRYGYGRVPQLAQQIETLWRDPNSQIDFEKDKHKLLEMLYDGKG